MSLLARYLPQRPLPASRRTYSSFFSSKSGGGRYFNSSKPPKPVVAGAAGKGKTEPNVSPTDVNDGVQGAGTGGVGSRDGGKQMVKADVDESHPPQGSSGAAPRDTPSQSMPHPDGLQPTSLSHLHRFGSTSPAHPSVNSKDFKLHQFFSLHRPLLLLSHPPSIFHSAPTTGTIFSPQSPGAEQVANAAPPPSPNMGMPEEPSEASHEADAEAARQLSRALTLNHAGGALAWEGTLRRLGLDVSLAEDRVGLKQQFEKEWEEVMLDSVKRKRRKKMKKHKLRKRRKATRAQRIKIGR